MFHKQLMRQIINMLSEEINKRSKFNSDPEKLPIIRLDNDDFAYRIKSMRMLVSNTDMVEIIYFENSVFSKYLLDLTTFGKKYEISTYYPLDDPELLEAVQQLLIRFDWTPGQMDRLFRMLKNINTN